MRLRSRRRDNEFELPWSFINGFSSMLRKKELSEKKKLKLIKNQLKPRKKKKVKGKKFVQRSKCYFGGCNSPKKYHGFNSQKNQTLS